jgi:hypothetical protein
MGKNDPSSTLSPFQRFEALAKALFAVPKKEADKTTEPRRKRRSRKKSASRP